MTVHAGVDGVSTSSLQLIVLITQVMVQLDPILNHVGKMEVLLLNIMLRVTICDRICSKLIIELFISSLSHTKISFKAFTFELISLNHFSLLCIRILKLHDFFFVVTFMESIVSTLSLPSFDHDES